MSSFRLHREGYDRFSSSGVSLGAAVPSFVGTPPQIILPQNQFPNQMSSLPGSLLSTSPVSLTFSGDTNPFTTNQVSLASTPLSATFDVSPNLIDQVSGLESSPPTESAEVGKQYRFLKWTSKDMKGRKDKNMRACLNCYVISRSCKFEPNKSRCQTCEKRGGYCKGDIEMPPLIQKEFLQGGITSDPFDDLELQRLAILTKRAQNSSTANGDCDYIEITYPVQQAEAPFKAQILQMVNGISRLFKTAPCRPFAAQPQRDNLSEFQVVSRGVCACLVLLGNLEQCIFHFSDGQAMSMVHVALILIRQLVLQTHDAFKEALTQIRLWITATRPKKSDAKKMMAVTAFHLGEIHRELSKVHPDTSSSHPLRYIMANHTETLSKLSFYGRGFNNEEFAKGQHEDIISMPLFHFRMSTDGLDQPHSVLPLSAILDVYEPLSAPQRQSLPFESRPIPLGSADNNPLGLQSNELERRGWNGSGIQEARPAQWQTNPVPTNMNIESLQKSNADIEQRITELLKIKSSNEEQIQKLQNEGLVHESTISEGVAFASDYHFDDLELSMDDVDMVDSNCWPSLSWVQDQAPLIDTGGATQFAPAQSLRQGSTARDGQETSLLDPPNPETLRQRKRRRMQEHFQGPPTQEEDLFDHGAMDYLQPPATEVIPTDASVDERARTDQSRVRDDAICETDGEKSRASVQDANVEMRSSPPPSPGGIFKLELDSGSGQSATTLASQKPRRPITWPTTWPTRAVRRSWTASRKLWSKSSKS